MVVRCMEQPCVLMCVSHQAVLLHAGCNAVMSAACALRAQPFWCRRVEKYEARRRQAAATTLATSATPATADGTEPSTSPAPSQPTNQPSTSAQQQATPSGAAARGSASASAPWWAKAASVLQLMAVNAALILWPASRQVRALHKNATQGSSCTSCFQLLLQSSVEPEQVPQHACLTACGARMVCSPAAC